MSCKSAPTKSPWRRVLNRNCVLPKVEVPIPVPLPIPLPMPIPVPIPLPLKLRDAPLTARPMVREPNMPEELEVPPTCPHASQDVATNAARTASTKDMGLRIASPPMSELSKYSIGLSGSCQSTAPAKVWNFGLDYLRREEVG
jgi:hypothetical protein